MDLVAVGRQIYRLYAATGRPPRLSVNELAALAADHAVVLDPAGAIAFANPFATGRSAFRVRTPGRIHGAICAWDALGVLAALGSDGTVEGHCPDCGQTISLEVQRGKLEPSAAVAHFLVPAARWYEDLASPELTCG